MYELDVFLRAQGTESEGMGVLLLVTWTRCLAESKESKGQDGSILVKQIDRLMACNRDLVSPDSMLPTHVAHREAVDERSCSRTRYASVF